MGDLAADGSRSASGTPQSSDSWLSDHYAAAREAYEAMLAYAEVEVGDRVLDAGCGAGDYVPGLALAAGPEGRVTAVDLDPLNVRRASAAAPGGVAVAAVERLPFADDAFDAVWCANVTEYVADEDLPRLLGELVRVTRPGGRVAVKDVDAGGLRIGPGDPLLAARLADACVTVPPVAVESAGSLRGRALRRWLERAGLVEVRQRTWAIDYWAPLPPPAERLWSAWLPYLARLAREHHVPARDLDAWARVATAQAARAFVRRGDFFASELQVVAVGRVPG